MWSKNEIMEWYERQPWIVGFNYVTSNAVNSTEMWQEESFSPNLIRKELMAAAELGYNSCRIFLQYILWKSEKRTSDLHGRCKTGHGYFGQQMDWN